MSFSYDAANPGNRDKVRLLIGDTTSTSYVFEDTELDVFLSLWSDDVHRAAAQALRTMAVDQAKRALDYRINGIAVSRTDRARQLVMMAESLEAASLKAPFEYESVLDRSLDAIGVDRSVYPDSGS